MSRITSVAATIATIAAVAGGSLAAAAPANAATTGCTPVSGGRTYLSPWNDTNTYVLAPGGAFSSTTTPWLTSKSFLSGLDNEPSNVTGSATKGVLVVGNGGTATSPATCVGYNDDRIRLFYRAPAGTSFKITTVATSGIGTATYNTWVTAPSSDWQLSPAVMIPDWTDATGTQQVKVTVSNPIGSAVKIDDVLVDPWRVTRW